MDAVDAVDAGNAGNAGSAGERAGGGEGHDSSRAVPGPHRVVIRMTDGMDFEPEQPTVQVGDTVVWVNRGSLPHTTTDSPGRAAVPEHEHLPQGARPWDSGPLASGEVFRHVFREPGEYTYLCTIHEAAGMVGRITVVTATTG